MIFYTTDFFEKRLNLLPTKIQIAFRKRSKLFLENPNYPLLKNHPLKGRLLGRRAFSVTGNFRVIYKILSEKEFLFTDIGTHNQVY